MRGFGRGRGEKEEDGVGDSNIGRDVPRTVTELVRSV